MTDNTTNGTDAQFAHNEAAPSQLIPPDADSGMRIRGYRADRLAYLLPGGALVVLGAFAGSFGRTTLAAVLVGVGVLLLALGAYLLWSTSAHTSAIDRLRGRVSMALRSRSLPLDRSGAADIHGVKQILGDGSVEMTDGRIVQFARLHGRNTDFQTAEEERTMVNALRSGLDSAVEIDFSVYSMSTSPDDTHITDKYKDIWLSDRYDRADSRDVIGYLKSIIKFESQRNDVTNATAWEHYLVVSVPPDEIDTPELDHVDTDAAKMAQQVEADSRLTTLCKAFGSVSGVEAKPITGPKHARVVARHWAGTRHPSDFDDMTDEPVSIAEGIEAETLGTGDSTSSSDDLPPLDPSLPERVGAGLGAAISTALRGVVGESDPPANPAQWGDDRINELLGASRWDERPSDDMVVVGDQYCRSYWIGDWPTRPTAKFLKELHTLRGIDMSVHHRFDARETAAVKEELKQATTQIDASITERKDGANALDAGVLEDEMDSYVQLFKLIHHTDVQPWGMSTYVTVRAGDRTALEQAESLIERGYDESDVSHDLAKRRALEDASEEVEETLESAGVTPVTDQNRQGDLFRAASPTSPDTYAERSVTRSRTRLAGTGVLAATFPNASTTVNHEMGVELGHNPTNGRVIAPDPFATEPAHRLTLGKSGSGKTWSTLKQSVRWYLSDPDDRTLVFIDNEGDFAGVTGLLNGSTITIGGTTTLNPLRMEPMDPDTIGETGLDPFTAKQRFVTGLILDLICETADARDRYRPLIRDGVEKAMEEAALDPDDPSTHTPENSPTMADVRDAVGAIADEPSAHARYESVEQEIEDNVGALLHRLESFSTDGEFSFLTGESDATVEPGDVTYLDLQQIEGMGATAHRTTMLSVALGEVYEAVKNAPGKTMFVIDEAHYLLKSPRILSWLDEAARHWRDNDAGLWFVTQHPGDFVVDEDDDNQQNKSVIRDQAQITDIFHTEDTEALADFDLNAAQIDFLSEEATKGNNSATVGSDCLIDHPEVEGWMEAQVTVSPAEYSIFSYDREKHGSYRDYLDEHWTRNDGVETDGGEH